MGCIPHFFLKSTSSKSNKQILAAEPKNQDDGVTTQYNWDEIVRLSRSFSCLIGSGGFSTVYLGHLSAASGLAAIKIHTGSFHLNRIFRQELNILLNLKHDNIVKLLGYCDHQDEGALVLEYVPNGSLQDRLHGAQLSEKYPKRSVPPVLSWRRRMMIAYQLAQAVEYLHEKCNLPIVHGDIKASNILLDEQLNCKLCDFGSAKMGFSAMVTPSSSRSSKRMIMMGSPGYTDPHYLRTGIPSKKNDVYSYGVIVLELVSGMEAFSEEKGLVLTSLMGACSSSECEVSKMVDPRLRGDFDMKEAKAMLSLAQLCVAESPTQRPTISQILSNIQENIPSVSFNLPPSKKIPNSYK